MKKIRITIVACLTVLLLLPSCSKYLDIKPKSQIKEESLLSMEKGFMDALTGGYTLMARRDLYGDILTMSFLDVLAQRYYVGAKTSPYWDAAHYNYQSDESKLPVQATIRKIWAQSYAVIANMNNLLEQIDDKKSIFIQNNYNMVKGEALAIRAFIHFDLLRQFGPIFNKNPQQLAIPYRTHVTRNGQPMLPASEVVDLILRDLKEAEVLLADDPIVTAKGSNYAEFMQEYRKFRMNLVAVRAELARVCLYANKKEEAFSYAKKVIQAGTYQFVTSGEAGAAGGCRDRIYLNEQLFALKINNIKSYVDLYFNTVPTTYENNVLCNTDQAINRVFEFSTSSKDIRRTYLWESKSGKLLHSKFWDVQTSIGACDFPKNIMPIIRISEIYYIAAESAPVVAEGVDYLNQVRGNRGLKPLIDVTNTAVLQKEIEKEYQKEFFSEGQLFYYYKRQGFSKIPDTSIEMNDNTYIFPVPAEEMAN